MRKKIVALNVFILFISFIVGFCVVEITTRLLGYTSFDTRQYHVFLKPDPIMGWGHVPGRHLFSDFAMTFLGDGRRITSPDPCGSKKQNIVIVGGSFSEGFFVNDLQTYAWKIQEAFPDFCTINYGVAGFGTLQSLLMLERYFSDVKIDGNPPSRVIVIYGFIGHHHLRNVAVYGWRKTFATKALDENRKQVAIPYALFDNTGQVRRYPPEAWPNWPLSEVSAVVALLQDRYVWWTTRDRREMAIAVTLALIEEMQELASHNGAKFVLVMLTAEESAAVMWKNRFIEKGVRFVDCKPQNVNNAAYIYPENRHPTPFLHSFYARCIVEYIENLQSPFEKVLH